MNLQKPPKIRSRNQSSNFLQACQSSSPVHYRWLLTPPLSYHNSYPFFSFYSNSYTFRTFRERERERERWVLWRQRMNWIDLIKLNRRNRSYTLMVSVEFCLMDWPTSPFSNISEVKKKTWHNPIFGIYLKRWANRLLLK